MRHLNGKQILAKLLLPDKLSSGKQMVLFFTQQPPQFIASKSQYPHLAVETKMKMRSEWYIALWDGPEAANDRDSEKALTLHAGYIAHLAS